MLVVSERVRAYVNHGRWVGDCNRPHCANAEKLTAGQRVFHCSNCRQISEVDWPPDAEQITQVLDKRPVPQTRNWFPSGHELAVRSGTPHGQSVADLETENHDYGVDV